MMSIRRQPISFWVMVILSLAVAFLIFMFSSQDSGASEEVSIGFAGMLFEKLFGPEFAESANHFIRKCAHFSIYLALGFCVRGAFSKSNADITAISASLFSALVCFLYASSDEIHQYFVPGRSCSVLDVLLDTFGALCGILISYFFFELVFRKRKSQ